VALEVVFLRMTTEAETCRSYEISIAVLHVLCTLVVIRSAVTDVYGKICIIENIKDNWRN
jgi:hypothetical protein